MKKLVLSIWISIAALPMSAQQPGEDPIAQQLFPPDLIMAHQDELGLQEKQRAAIKSEVLKAQPKFLEAQWEVGDESQKMIALLRATPIDEAKVLEQADRVMALERDVKRTHLGLLIRVKNLLTPEQIKRLEQIRRK